MIMQTLNHMKDNPTPMWTFPEYLFFILVNAMTVAGLLVFFPALFLKAFFLSGLSFVAFISGMAIILYILDGGGHQL